MSTPEQVASQADTSHLSVESIIKTYADRLRVAYPDNAPEIIEERNILLGWWRDHAARLRAVADAARKVAPADVHADLSDDLLVTIQWPDVYMTVGDYRALRERLAALDGA